MKTVQMIAAVVAVLLTTSTSNAGSWFKVERPCASKCIAPRPIVSLPPAWSVVGAVPFREFKEPD